jgi:hypothetical protein
VVSLWSALTPEGINFCANPRKEDILAGFYIVIYEMMSETQQQKEQQEKVGF